MTGGHLDYLRCAHCKHKYHVDEKLPTSNGRPRCPNCEQGGPAIEASQPIPDRWPDGVATKWVALPVPLLVNGEHLGLKCAHKVLLLALEAHRYNGYDAVYPGNAKLAEMAGLSTRSVKRALAELVNAGLLERHLRPGTPTSYTRDGLGDALADLHAGRKPRYRIAPTRATVARVPGPKTTATRAKSLARNEAEKGNRQETEASPRRASRDAQSSMRADQQLTFEQARLRGLAS